MKVLIFMTQFYLLNGAEQLAVELAEELNKRGIQTDILSMYTENLAGVQEAKEALLQKGIPAVHFLGLPVHPSFMDVLKGILKLRHLIRGQGYQIVETSMVSPMVIASWAMYSTGVRHVMGLHQVYRRDRDNSLQHEIFRFTARCIRSNQYYAISNCVARYWTNYSKTPPHRIRVIYNAISDKFFNIDVDRAEVRRNLAVPEHANILIYVGRLAAYKGINTILHAVGDILKQNNIFLLYVGLPDLSVKGTKEMLLAMNNQISRNKWGERVKFLGRRSDVPNLMASSDILVHPARNEGFGLVLAEAMAVGLPVVASNVDGIPEVLAESDSTMVPPDEPDALREAILQTLCRTREERIQAIEKGRKRAKSFRINTRVEAMMELFDNVQSGLL